jgi:hypothetical protein
MDMFNSWFGYCYGTVRSDVDNSFEECMKVLDAVIAKQDASKDINTFRDLWDNNINHLEINN